MWTRGRGGRGGGALLLEGPVHAGWLRWVEVTWRPDLLQLLKHFQLKERCLLEDCCAIPAKRTPCVWPDLEDMPAADAFGYKKPDREPKNPRLPPSGAIRGALPLYPVSWRGRIEDSPAY